MNNSEKIHASMGLLENIMSKFSMLATFDNVNEVYTLYKLLAEVADDLVKLETTKAEEVPEDGGEPEAE